MERRVEDGGREGLREAGDSEGDDAAGKGGCLGPGSQRFKRSIRIKQWKLVITIMIPFRRMQLWKPTKLFTWIPIRQSNNLLSRRKIRLLGMRNAW